MTHQCGRKADFRPRLETLEDRTVPAVANLDTGDVVSTIQAAIDDANTVADHATGSPGDVGIDPLSGDGLASSFNGVADAIVPEMSLNGELNGAPYSIRVPTHWNGTLLVYAHAYRDQGDHPGEIEERRAFPAPSPLEFSQFPDMELLLLSKGYALAASAFRDNGWTVKEGVEDTRALVSLFRHRVAQPRCTILYGFSMGGLIALQGAEQPRGLYDGVISAGGLSAGAPRTWDSTLDFALAHEQAFEWPAAWGSPGDVRDDLDFETEVVPVLASQLADPSNRGRFEFIRLVTRGPLPGFYDGKPLPALFGQALFATEGRAELERRAGGPAAQNLDHRYTLSDEEKAYLKSLGVDADPLLKGMNETEISADRHVRRSLARNFDPTGRIKVPVLTLKTTDDGWAPTYHEYAYREAVASQGKLDLLAQA